MHALNLIIVLFIIYLKKKIIVICIIYYYFNVNSAINVSKTLTVGLLNDT